MKRTIIITKKTALANHIKKRLEQNGENTQNISMFKSIPNKLEEVEIFIIDESLALRGYKKEFKTILQIRENNADAKIIILGNDDLSLRMKSRIDGADDYIALQMLTSELFDEYLSKVIYKN